MSDILKSCVWKISNRGGRMIFFHCDVHDHNKVSVDPITTTPPDMPGTRTR